MTYSVVWKGGDFKYPMMLCGFFIASSHTLSSIPQFRQRISFSVFQLLKLFKVLSFQSAFLFFDPSST